MARILIHPGEHLADELKALGMSANELAKELGVPTNRLTEIIRGKRGISGDTALRLGRWFGTGPDIWMNLQKNYELRLAAQEIGDALQKIPEHKRKQRRITICGRGKSSEVRSKGGLGKLGRGGP